MLTCFLLFIFQVCFLANQSSFRQGVTSIVSAPEVPSGRHIIPMGDLGVHPLRISTASPPDKYPTLGWGNSMCAGRKQKSSSSRCSFLATQRTVIPPFSVPIWAEKTGEAVLFGWFGEVLPLVLYVHPLGFFMEQGKKGRSLAPQWNAGERRRRDCNYPKEKGAKIVFLFFFTRVNSLSQL